MPKEKIVVFLHIGHSNMAGRTNTPPELRPFNYETHPQLWAFTHLRLAAGARAAVWRLPDPWAGGPGMSILRTALAMAPMRCRLHRPRPGRLARRPLQRFRRGGLLYEMVMGPARQLKGKVTFGGIFSMLVLMEAFIDKPSWPPRTSARRVAADMRADLGDPDIPFLMSDWEMGATGALRSPPARRRDRAGSSCGSPRRTSPVRPSSPPTACPCPTTTTSISTVTRSGPSAPST